MVCWAVGFLVGVGAFVGPSRWLLGRDLSHQDEEFLAGKDAGVWRYFRFTTDHKVVGMQYLVTTMVLFAVGGTLAMLIRTNLITPGSHLVGPLQYNELVGLHGIIMIIATIVMVSGPFGNFILPIMIGARDMAFPRLNALSYWLLFAAVPVLLSAFFLGGIPTGWSAYAPLSDQAPPGMDAFLVIHRHLRRLHRACRRQHHDDGRPDARPWDDLEPHSDLRLRRRDQRPARTHRLPHVHGRHGRLAMDRSLGATFYVFSGGGSGWLYSNLFWLMGHPEVYVILLPAMIAMLEITPVFTRKPLFSFNGAVLGIGGIVGLSLFVWAHHMYMAGWAPRAERAVHGDHGADLDPHRAALPGAARHDLARHGVDAPADDGRLRACCGTSSSAASPASTCPTSRWTRPSTGRCSSPRTSTTR